MKSKFNTGDIVITHENKLGIIKEIINSDIIGIHHRVHYYDNKRISKQLNYDWLSEIDIRLYKPVLKKFIEEMEKKDEI